MLVAFRTGLLLTLVLACSTVSAQELTRTIAESSAPEPLPAYPGERMTLEQLCDRATRTLRARQWTRDHGVLWCRAERTSDPEIALVIVHYPDGDEALLARRDRGALRVLGVVDECLGGPDGNAGCAISFASLRAHETTRGTVLSIETTSVTHDYDLGVLAGVRIERRHLAVCSARGCAIGVPLEVSIWDIELTERSGRPVWPFDERATLASSSRAIAVIRRDGSLRLTLRSGHWRALYEDTRHSRAQPDAALREVIVRE